MAIILGGVKLSDHLIWVDRFNSEVYVASSLRRTLGGRPVIQTARLYGCSYITLQATEEQGWLFQDQVDALNSLAEDIGAVYSLAIGLSQFIVSFRHFDPPAFAASQLDQVGAQAPAGAYTATIKLHTV